jgi:hypothetical protein
MVEHRLIWGFLALCVLAGVGLLWLTSTSDERGKRKCEASCAASGSSYIYVPATTNTRFMEYLTPGECRCVQPQKSG